MSKQLSLVKARIEVPRDADLPPLSYGSYDFVVLPRVQENLALSFGNKTIYLRVKEVVHQGYGVDATPTLWDCMITLNCEKLDAPG